MKNENSSARYDVKSFSSAEKALNITKTNKKYFCNKTGSNKTVLGLIV